MKKRISFDQKLFHSIYFHKMLIAMTPSFIVDGVLIYRLVFRLLDNQAKGIGPLFVDFGLLLVMNAILLKSIPVILYFVQRSLLRQSFVIVEPDKVIFRKRLLVMYEFDYGYVHFHEYHLTVIDSFKKRGDGSLVVKGNFKARCLLEDGEQETDLRKGELRPRICNRKICRIPAVFRDMEHLEEKLIDITAK